MKVLRYVGMWCVALAVFALMANAPAEAQSVDFSPNYPMVQDYDPVPGGTFTVKGTWKVPKGSQHISAGWVIYDAAGEYYSMGQLPSWSYTGSDASWDYYAFPAQTVPGDQLLSGGTTWGISIHVGYGSIGLMSTEIVNCPFPEDP